MESSNVQLISMNESSGSGGPSASQLLSNPAAQVAGAPPPAASFSMSVPGPVSGPSNSVPIPVNVPLPVPLAMQIADPEPECKRRRLPNASSSLKGANQDCVASGSCLDLRLASCVPTEDRLEERLWNVLCCAVCLELPMNSIYQCTQGHLICTQCFNHLLADARLKDEQATCASCRCAISRDTCTRNLAVEKAVREMPGTCRHCARQLPRVQLPVHESERCEERPVDCGFRAIGCLWKGPCHERSTHEHTCLHPNKSGRDVMDSVLSLDQQRAEDRRLQQCIFSLLSFEKIVFSDLQLKPYRTDEYIHRLFYETSRFAAFNYHFVVKARINDDQKDPTQSCDRRLTYQLVLKSKITTPFALHYLVLKVSFLFIFVSSFV
jgi:hypothetical protein